MIGQLRCRKDGLSPQEFVATGGIGLRHPGLYSCDPVGAATLSAGLGHRIEPGLIDAGLAGATHNRSGNESSNDPGSDMESVIARAWGWLMQQPSLLAVTDPRFVGLSCPWGPARLASGRWRGLPPERGHGV